MLGKLLRYEFRALLRIMPALYLAILALALVTGINSYITGGWGMAAKILEAALGVMYIALFIVNLVIIILRFRDNLLKDEGYLMFTLPVTEWELTASKAIAGLCSFLLTAAVGIIALLIWGFIADYMAMLENLSLALQHGNRYADRIGLALLAINAVSLLIFGFQQICLIYASMTVSQMAPRFRGLAGFGVYLAVMIVMERLFKYFFGEVFFPSLGYCMAILLSISLFAALCFCCTGWLLKRTLNLE
jgi:hypothetical protein